MGVDAIGIVVRVDASRWRRAVPGVQALAERAACAAAVKAKKHHAGEIAVVLSDDATVRKLNRDYRGKDKPTNVLSFPNDGGVDPDGAMAPLGDVVLALETVLAEARDQGKRAGDHLSHLVVHGVLHLFGHDHLKDAEARRMEALETKILAGL
ncbi:MAG: rRNA maturation RNase YbeY, partial [Rhodospirillales bacterium]|nr:rRNA maturation RNase YbeY [Rhodospirillales bacterium]